MKIYLSINPKMKCYEVAMKGAIAYYALTPENVAWAAITAISWKEVVHPTADILLGEGIPQDALHQGMQLIQSIYG